MWKEAGPPPELATRLFSERIMYLGMPIDSSVAELLTAQLFVLVQEAPDPIYLYINSTGIAVSYRSESLPQFPLLTVPACWLFGQAFVGS